jgi:hypothetical protein
MTVPLWSGVLGICDCNALKLEIPYESVSVETERQSGSIPRTKVLPFVSMPHSVSVLRLRLALRFRPPSLSLAQVGTFIHNGDEIWSFAPLPILSAAFEAVLDPELTRSHSRAEIEATSAGRKPLSWLLRKHFERYMSRFGAQGLFLQGDTNDSRAYFHGTDGKARTLAHIGGPNRDASRNVVVQRHGGRRPWFRNEGFGYDIVAHQGVWGVAIKPFYIFTGSDAKKPLPYAAQIEQSQRWNGRDVKTGDSHLAFWRDFLTAGASLVDLREEHVDNLFLGCQLVEFPLLAPLPAVDSV